jgi:trehalose 6-phosphate phosphatase
MNTAPAPIPSLAQQWALFLDVDGTLLDFAPTPDAVYVPPPLIALLAQLQTQLQGALALVSGRSIMVLDHLFAPLRLPSAGLHGLERRDYQGVQLRAAVDMVALEQMRTAATTLKRAFPNVLIEDKHYAVALHYGEAQTQQMELRAAVEQIARETGFELQAGRLVFELKPPAVNKGDSLTAFLAEAPFSGRLPVFLGDDLTDVHALAVAQQRGGMAIQVGSRLVNTAPFALADPTAVLRWLQHWGERLHE